MWDYYNRISDKVDHFRNFVRYHRFYAFNRFYMGDWSYDIRPQIGVLTSEEGTCSPIRYIAVCLFKSSLAGIPIASVAYYRSCEFYRHSTKVARQNALRLFKRFPAFGLIYGLSAISSSWLFEQPNSAINHSVAGTMATYAFYNSWKWSGVVKGGAGTNPIVFTSGALFIGCLTGLAKQIILTQPDLSKEPQMYDNPLHWRRAIPFLRDDLDERRRKDAQRHKAIIEYQLERNKEFEENFEKWNQNRNDNDH